MICMHPESKDYALSNFTTARDTPQNPVFGGSSEYEMKVDVGNDEKQLLGNGGEPLKN